MKLKNIVEKRSAKILIIETYHDMIGSMLPTTMLPSNRYKKKD